jgi:hypothetical protein
MTTSAKDGAMAHFANASRSNSKKEKGEGGRIRRVRKSGRPLYDVAWVEFEHFPEPPKGKAKRFRLTPQQVLYTYPLPYIGTYHHIRPQPKPRSPKLAAAALQCIII